jgi:hypothetical protein
MLNVAGKVKKFVRQLRPLARTPYMLCPMGMDFIKPLAGLTGLLGKYNEQCYPDTGIWCVNAGMDDYLDLVGFHRDKLPELNFDPNPYWTGFYTSRPSLKQRSFRLSDVLVNAEAEAFRSSPADGHELNKNLAEPWWWAATSNHHDFITGTAPDHTTYDEQQPWLDRSLEIVRPYLPVDSVSGRQGELPCCSQGDNGLEIVTEYFRISLDANQGGRIRKITSTNGELLQVNANSLNLYRESGGLWRMGNEYKGGSWNLEASNNCNVEFNVKEKEDCLEVSFQVKISSASITQTYRFFQDREYIEAKISGLAPEHCTLTVAFTSGTPIDYLVMDNPGGMVKRPAQKNFDPTYWPMQSRVDCESENGERGLGLVSEYPTAVSGSGRKIELVALRNATHERAFGLLPIPGMPISGRERESTSFRYRIGPPARKLSAFTPARFPVEAESESGSGRQQERVSLLFPQGIKEDVRRCDVLERDIDRPSTMLSEDGRTLDLMLDSYITSIRVFPNDK